MSAWRVGQLLRYQQREGLTLAARLRSRRRDPLVDTLSGEALRVALERPTGWEFRLFAVALTDAVASRHRLRRRHTLGVPLGLGEDVNDPFAWVKARFQDALRLTGAFDVLVNRELAAALSATDQERILFVVESIGQLYDDSLRWANKILSANVRQRFRPALEHLSGAMDDVIEEIEKIGPTVTSAVEKAMAVIEAGGQPDPISLKFNITVPEDKLEAFQQALQDAVRADDADD